MSNIFDAEKFVVQKAKPMPVILLLDESGSMSNNNNIGTLNLAVRKMLATLRKEETQASEFLVTIIGFGGKDARTICEASPASGLEYSDLTASGRTPLGSAIALAKDVIEDRERTPGRAYRPLVVLVSDGEPTDINWQDRLDDFIDNDRTAKCDRMALAIGSPKEEAMAVLNRFIEGTDRNVFTANQADEIIKFFKFVTMTVTGGGGGGADKPIAEEAKPAPAEQEEAAESLDEEEGFW